MLRPQPEYNQHAAARQSIWTQVLDPGRTPGSQPQAEAPTHQRDTFIQLEPASHSMTKAFTPHGLLSAGMQDKQDRSAKRQEELARETGGSLINVPNKPPPPQTGLLGAITAHERERKREGGVGAALTEREREKRLAEERQRKIDEFQRQQLDMQSMYGQQYPNMMANPMMANPMMMGMNPMMAGNPMMANPNPMMANANPMMTGMGGGYMGFPNMMQGYGNPQFFAQQAAQAAYQQAMMAYSSGGSHVADGMHPTPMNPMMTGGGMGFDPRMSMMGMPVMSAPMGMNGMGMGMAGGGMGGMPGMGMQMTGGSAFDARFAPGNIEDLRPPASLAHGQRAGQSSSRNSSAGQGSPAGPRPVDARDSPKH
jgi:CCR4-NOT transcriptional complex subunit CAF120